MTAMIKLKLKALNIVQGDNQTVIVPDSLKIPKIPKLSPRSHQNSTLIMYLKMTLQLMV